MYKIEEIKDYNDGRVTNVIGIFDDLTLAKAELDNMVLSTIKEYKKMYKKINYSATWENNMLVFEVEHFPELSAVYEIIEIDVNQLHG